MRYVCLFAVPLIVLGLAGAQAFADDEGKPFAEARIVLQMADADAESQTRVLNVANNLIKHYGGPDFVDIEIVAYGPGLSLLFPGSANEERISSLLANDVRFVGCLNTVESIERATGKRPELIPETVSVQTGIARLVERAQQGFVVIRP
jgi:intracellular sulfur oxidation DsrE/DsrF family protein